MARHKLTEDVSDSVVLIARMADDGFSLEVTRVAVIEGHKNACSALYGACARAAKAMGALDLWTTIHADEPGTSLKAAGWINLGECGGGGQWSRESRQRDMAFDAARKIKWAPPWTRLAKGLLNAPST